MASHRRVHVSPRDVAKQSGGRRPKHGRQCGSVIADDERPCMKRLQLKGACGQGSPRLPGGARPRQSPVFCVCSPASLLGASGGMAAIVTSAAMRRRLSDRDRPEWAALVSQRYETVSRTR